MEYEEPNNTLEYRIRHADVWHLADNIVTLFTDGDAAPIDDKLMTLSLNELQRRLGEEELTKDEVYFLGEELPPQVLAFMNEPTRKINAHPSHILTLGIIIGNAKKHIHT